MAIEVGCFGFLSNYPLKRKFAVCTLKCTRLTQGSRSGDSSDPGRPKVTEEVCNSRFKSEC